MINMSFRAWYGICNKAKDSDLRQNDNRRKVYMAISLTPAAATRVEKFLASRGKGIGLRLGVKTTGCSGMAYTLEFVDDMQPEDTSFDSHGVKVIVDPKSLAYIDGTELDFTKEGLNEGFKFNNPNVKDECGCGESFTVWHKIILSFLD